MSRTRGWRSAGPHRFRAGNPPVNTGDDEHPVRLAAFARRARRSRRRTQQALPTHARASPYPHLTSDRINQLERVEAHAILEHGLDPADIRDRRRRVSVDDHQIRLLADGDRADARVAAKISRAV